MTYDINFIQMTHIFISVPIKAARTSRCIQKIYQGGSRILRFVSICQTVM